jgi:glucokinase
MRKRKTIAIGVDIGGTKVAAGLVDSRGRILFSTTTAMQARGTPAAGLAQLFRAVDVIRGRPLASQARAIGVAVPGWVDAERGVLLNATNIPCWRNFPLARNLRRHASLPVCLGNDANLAALAESRWGAGSKYSSVFYVTLGTGIGSGFVLDRRIVAGRAGMAGEGGHMTIDSSGPLCGCGKRGCIELYASGTAIARRARERLTRRGARHSSLPLLARGQVARLTTEMVSGAAAAGDVIAKEIMHGAADALAIWLGNIIDLLEPEVIVFGGGLGARMMTYRRRIRAGLATWAINPRRNRIAIVAAHFGPESALAGAAALGMTCE